MLAGVGDWFMREQKEPYFYLLGNEVLHLFSHWGFLTGGCVGVRNAVMPAQGVFVEKTPGVSEAE